MNMHLIGGICSETKIVRLYHTHKIGLDKIYDKWFDVPSGEYRLIDYGYFGIDENHNEITGKLLIIST